MEQYKGKKVHCFDLALELMSKDPEKFTPLLTHTFTVDRYRDALNTTRNKRRNRVIKAAFDFR